MPGSFVSTRSSRCPADADPSATLTCPLTQPADARGKALKRHPLPREPDPAMQVLVLGEELEHQLVGAMQVARVPRKRDPPERAFALAEQGPDVLGNEARDFEGVGDPCVPCLRADVVSIVEGDRSTTLEHEHR